MILADKITKLRKQLGWSQEELAEKMNISRQSVSKWESTNSIPDLNKIILLAKIFNVSTDYLLMDDMESCDSVNENTEPSVPQINLEQAVTYVEQKIEISNLIGKGVMFCVCSVVPLLLLLAMADNNILGLTGNLAAALGVVAILIMICLGIRFFLKTNQYESDIDLIENDPFELTYGVHSVFKDKLKKFRVTYNRKLSISIFLFIISFVPLMFTSMFYSGSGTVLLMLIVMLLIISAGIFLLTPASAQYEAYNHILRENGIETKISRRTKRAEKLAAFYWPLLTAIYLGWSLWTMHWGITWIVWPVGGVLFAALVGLMELFDKEEV